MSVFMIDMPVGVKYYLIVVRCVKNAATSFPEPPWEFLTVIDVVHEDSKQETVKPETHPSL